MLSSSDRKGGASLFNLQKKMQTLSVGRQLDAYTGVVIHCGQDANGNEVTISAGDATGYVLEIDNPLGTQQMADTILSGLKLRGQRYQPYDASSALLDPSAEIGDAVTVDGTASVLLSASTKHGRLMAADISAPYEKEVDHEFTYEPRIQREFKRESAYTRARLTIAEDSIEAKVSRTGGNASSFGWILDADAHTWYANDSEVMRVNRNGLRVQGEIVATSGVIGNCRIVNGILEVDSASIRNVNADYITVGTLSVDRILNGSLTGSKIASETITGGSGGNIVGSGISTYNTVSGINTNLGYGAAYGLATQQNAGTYPSWFSVGYLSVHSAISMYDSSGGGTAAFTPKSATIGGVTIHYLGW